MDRLAVNLDDEPLSISVVEHARSGGVSLSDVPDRLLPALIDAYGEGPIARCIAPSDEEREFWMGLPVMKRRPFPRFTRLHRSGELARRAAAVDASRRAAYFMTAINLADEPVLGKTGVIYLVCRKGCHFCQYRGFSEYWISADEIADRMLALEAGGADNVQFLSPTAYTALIVKAIHLAAERGFSLPIVHKSEGEDDLDDLALLDGLVDVYLPDIKFVRPRSAPRIGLSPQYPRRMEAAIREMLRQVGPLTRRSTRDILHGPGLLVRHLLMPGGLDELRGVLAAVRGIDRRIPVHVMTGYEPLHGAKSVPGIDRALTRAEIQAAGVRATEADLDMVLVR